MSEKEVTERDNSISQHNLFIGFVVLLGIFGQMLTNHYSLLLFSGISCLGLALILIAISYIVTSKGWDNRREKDKLLKETEKSLEKSIKDGKSVESANLILKIANISYEVRKIERWYTLNNFLTTCSTILIVVSVILFIISLRSFIK